MLCFRCSQVWVEALAQTLMSMGIAYGCLMAFGSYNRFHTPFVRDAFCLSGLNALTSLIAGIIVFAAIGHSASVHNLPINQTATDGKTLCSIITCFLQFKVELYSELHCDCRL